MEAKEAELLRSRYEGIPTASREKFERFMVDEFKKRRSKRRDPGLVSADDWLIQMGLIEETGLTFMDAPLWRLSADGRALARAIVMASDGQVSDGPFRFIDRIKFMSPE